MNIEASVNDLLRRVTGNGSAPRRLALLLITGLVGVLAWGAHQRLRHPTDRWVPWTFQPPVWLLGGLLVAWVVIEAFHYGRTRPATDAYHLAAPRQWLPIDSFAVALFLAAAASTLGSVSDPDRLTAGLAVLAVAFELARVTVPPRTLQVIASAVRVRSELGEPLVRGDVAELRFYLDADDRIACQQGSRRVVIGGRFGVFDANTTAGVIDRLCSSPRVADLRRWASAVRAPFLPTLGGYRALALATPLVAAIGCAAMTLGRSPRGPLVLVGAMVFTMLALLALGARDLWSRIDFAARPSSTPGAWLRDDGAPGSLFQVGLAAIAIPSLAVPIYALGLLGSDWPALERGETGGSLWAVFFGWLVLLAIVRVASERSARRSLHAMAQVSILDDELRIARPMALDGTWLALDGLRLDRHDRSVTLRCGDRVVLRGTALGDAGAWDAIAERVNRRAPAGYR